MKYFIIIGFLIFSTCSLAQSKKADKNEQIFGLFKFYQNDTIQARIKDIVRSDSIKNSETGFLIYKSYDTADIVVRELKYYEGQSNSKNGYLIRNIYDKYGKIILYELIDMEGIEIECYKYDYDHRGLLLTKSGFGSGEIGIKIHYYYSDFGVLIDKKAFRFGKEVKDYFKTM